MSELKATSSGEIRTRNALLVYWWYEKYEADAVIAEKDKEIEKLKESIGKLLKSKTEQIMDEVLEKVIIYGDGFVPVEHAMKLVAEIRHSNHKRCLAMAWWCDAEADVADADGDYEDMRWYQKWHQRWLKLAEQFKEVKLCRTQTNL